MNFLCIPMLDLHSEYIVQATGNFEMKITNRQVNFSSIEWDCESAGKDLPAEVVLDVPFTVETDLSQEGADILSDKYGECVVSFSFEILKPEKQQDAGLSI